jgi:hypothetical protein
MTPPLVGLDFPRREELPGLFREVAAGPGALVDLGPAFGDRLAHLARHRFGNPTCRRLSVSAKCKVR